MTVASSSSSSSDADRAPEDEARRPLIELNDVGVCFRPRGPRRSLKELAARRPTTQRAPVRWALDGVDLTCYEGEAIGIIGPNGAGKSTLCLVLAGILTPDRGSATINGRVSSLLTLGAGFNQELSGRDNIRLYAAFLGIPRRKIDELMDEIIAFSELGAMIDEPFRHYSSGMRARLGFSIATSLDPEILILDEVLSVGDRKFRPGDANASSR